MLPRTRSKEKMELRRVMTTGLSPVRTERLSAVEFKKLMQSSSASLVERSRFLPPRLGGRRFGSFVVVYKMPIFKKI
jgi:hypothetical protein